MINRSEEFRFERSLCVDNLTALKASQMHQVVEFDRQRSFNNKKSLSRNFIAAGKGFH
jgi:hypothetical protein